MREMCWNLPGFALSSCQVWRKSSDWWCSLAWLWCVTLAARPCAAHPAAFMLFWLLLSGDWKQSSLHLQPGFDLGIKSLLCILFFPKPYCSSCLAGEWCVSSASWSNKCTGFAVKGKRQFYVFILLLVFCYFTELFAPSFKIPYSLLFRGSAVTAA